MTIVYLLLPFLKSIEDLLNLSSPSELGWKEFDLPFAVHLPPQPSIFEKIPGLRLKLEDKAQFVDPSFRFNSIQEDGMEEGDILFPRFDPRMNRQVPQGIHDLGDIDVVWASNATGIAGGTDPDGFRREDLFSMVILDMTEDLIG